jgi:hypothetical protein
MTEEKKPLKIEFAPGCFDNFDGTQEELDDLVSELTRLVESGELMDEALEIDLDELGDEDLETLAQALEEDENPNMPKRLLN